MADDDPPSDPDTPVVAAAATLTDEDIIRDALINKLGKARSNLLGKAKKRLELIVKIAKDEGRCFATAFANADEEKTALGLFLSTIQGSLSKENSEIKKWTGVKVAAKLFEFHDLLMAADRLKDKGRSKKDPPFVTEIRLIVENVEKELQADAEKAPKSLSKKMDKYRSGGSRHDNQLLVDLVDAHPAHITCPFCTKDGHHPPVMLMDYEENQKKISEDKAEYEAELAAFENLPAAQRTNKKKPKRKTIKQMVACVCSLNHYKGNVDGTGCRECMGRRTDDPLFLAGRQPCLTCRCYCTAMFPLHEINTIAKYLQDEKGGILPQENVDKEGK